MDLLVLVILLCVVGFIVYLLTRLVPMPPQWAQAIQILALIVMLLYVLTRLVVIPNLLR